MGKCVSVRCWHFFGSPSMDYRKLLYIIICIFGWTSYQYLTLLFSIGSLVHCMYACGRFALISCWWNYESCFLHLLFVRVVVFIEFLFIVIVIADIIFIFSSFHSSATEIQRQKKTKNIHHVRASGDIQSNRHAFKMRGVSVSVCVLYILIWISFLLMLHQLCKRSLVPKRSQSMRVVWAAKIKEREMNNIAHHQSTYHILRKWNFSVRYHCCMCVLVFTLSLLLCCETVE